ncbi:MAG: NADH:flavin oxidoreductase [Planctomycetes bacterium]|nr:NADH:flavin oxidoreductase [Planctomycetota bacterium]
MAAYRHLFSAFTIKSVTLRNRVVVPPLVQVRPITSPEGLGWYRRMARGGAGMVIVQATNNELFGNELTPQSLRPLVDTIHSEGAAAVVQLFPGPFGRDRQVDDLSTADVEALVAAFGVAARVCRDAGFDGVEPHGAHSYLMHNFFKPDQNHRTDRYGGSAAGRARFAVESVRAMREAAGDALLLLYRHTPTGAEYGLDESIDFARHLIDAGCDVLDISPARDKSVADLAAPIRAACGAAVIAVGGMERPGDAESALTAGRCDLVAVGRQSIADAAWPEKVRQGRPDDVRRCIKCGKCSEMLTNRVPVCCVLWDEDEVAAHMAAP